MILVTRIKRTAIVRAIEDEEMHVAMLGVLMRIKHVLDQHGPSTIREICANAHIDEWRAEEEVKALERRGYLTMKILGEDEA